MYMLYNLGIIGNKKDLVEDRRVSTEEAQLKATDNKCIYHECSALTGEGIDEAFGHIVEEYLTRKKN